MNEELPESDFIYARNQERNRIVDAIRQMQKEQHSNFISGNDLIDIIYNNNKTKPAEPQIWNLEYECW